MSELKMTGTELKAVIMSHGWYTLPPFLSKVTPPTLSVAFDLPMGSGTFTVRANGHVTGVTVTSGSRSSCLRVARQCLSLDVDIERFYDRVSADITNWGWLIANGLGRFLRSPSLYEDCAKALMTTNTNWARTTSMVKNLVEGFGRKVGNQRAFPPPSVILDKDESEIRSVVGCGFRAKYFSKIAEKAEANHPIFLEPGWRTLSSSDFHALLLGLPGIGESSANYLSLIYGKPYKFNIDSYVRRRAKELFNVDVDQIVDYCSRRYHLFEEYAPTALWFEITKHWHHQRLGPEKDGW